MSAPSNESRFLYEELVAVIAEMKHAHAELAAARDEAELRSRTDALTGVFNRRQFQDALDTAVAAAATGEAPAAVFLLDVDHFKLINDTHGHGVGDEVLAELAGRLARQVRREDTVARWGGEEFIVLLRAIDDDETLRRIGDGLRHVICVKPIETSAGSLQVSASFGGVRLEPELHTAERLVEAADRALYSAKRRGRNQVRLWSELTERDLTTNEPEAVGLAQALALAAGIRDGLPELHSQQVAELAVAVADRLGASPATQLRCRLGGWLHDVGKIAIPDRVLAKAGKLDLDEWALMQRHTLIGEQMVRRIPGLVEAAAAVRHHHERFDGTGYPDGLAGDQIPLEARIIAAVDAFSAITNERVYGHGRSREDAIEEMRRCSGTHFDPAVVQALVACLEDEAARLRRRLAARRTDQARAA
jgi:diguanylate cyclase (GGDEF)-like protein